MHTALYDLHLQANAKIVDFHGWDMPLHYGSQIDEHHAIRQDCGMFDVSHMTVVDVEGSQAGEYLRILLANDVAKIVDGQAMYSCMLNEQGGVIDDLIAYKVNDQHYRLVVNSSTKEKDLAWLDKHAVNFTVAITHQADKCVIAVQGPKAREQVAKLFTQGDDQEILMDLKPFRFVALDHRFVARTGYTGEDGFEIIFDVEDAKACWQQLVDQGVKPCGLGARDTLRLEAGMNLYGNDMDETISPLVSNLAWTIPFEPHERIFIGRLALEAEKARGITQQLVGLVLEDKGVLRDGLSVTLENGGTGVITSGSFSPTMGKGIAMARITLPISSAKVDLRGKLKNVSLYKPGFVRKGQVVCKPLEVEV